MDDTGLGASGTGFAKPVAGVDNSSAETAATAARETIPVDFIGAKVTGVWAFRR